MSELQDILLIYDKECPACKYYCELARIRDSVGNLVLVNARDGGPMMGGVSAAGLDIDQGMVLKIGDEFYHGADAMHTLSLMSTRSDTFNRLSYFFFRSKRVAALLYPLLRGGRNLLLKILGRSKVNNLGKPRNDRF